MSWPPKRSDFAVRLGKILAARRQGAGMSQASLANRLGVTQTVVSQWERGVGQPSADRLVALVSMFEISPAELDELAGLAIAS